MKQGPYTGKRYPKGTARYSLPGCNWQKIPQQHRDESLLGGGEVELIYDMPRIAGPGLYCNLGHDIKGGSAFLLASGAKDLELEIHVFSVDVFLTTVEGPSHFVISRNHHKRSSFREQVSLCRGTTDRWFEKFKQRGREFQFVFIDAGHKYPNVHNDWFNYKSLVLVGGYVAFHDTNQEDVHRVLEEGPLVDPSWEEQKNLHVNRIRVFRRVACDGPGEEIE
jgi:predicted O-methyltransferase YrrM